MQFNSHHPAVAKTPASYTDLPEIAQRRVGRPTFTRKCRISPAFLVGFLALGIGLLTGASSVEANPFHVSPSGNDSNPGTEGSPFKTIERARTAARGASANQSRDVTVFIRNGRYELSDTLRFDGNDSGRNGHKVIYRAYPGERPTISGGRKVTGWSHYRDGIYKASSPVQLYRQLYVNGKKATRARTPNTDFHRLSAWNGDKTIRIPSNQISNWSNLQDVEMVIMKHWNQSRLRIGSFHTSGDSATVVPREPERTVEWLVEWPNREPNQPYYFENSLDFLDQPGEWYLDRRQQTVYYKPRQGEEIGTSEVVAPRLERLLDVRGASNLHFAGLTFEHSSWTGPSDEGFIGIQAGSLRVLTTGALIPSALYIESTQHVRFERNVIRNLGTSGLELASGTYQTQVVGNAFADIAGNGVSVYTLLSDRYPPEHKRSRGDTLRNNFITRVAQDYTGAVGIFASYTDGVVIENNELTDMPYTAINVGWGWSNMDTAARNNVIRYNRIHNVMNLMDDGAGIYTLSKQPGSLIEENHIYNLTRNPWAGYYEIAGLYLDEQSEGFTMRNNVVQKLSGVMVWKQNRANSNTIHTNGDGIPNQQAIIDRAGLQSSFSDVPGMVSGNPPATAPAEGPFGATAAAIPGRIEAENFDEGGAEVAYKDTTSVNQGGQHRGSDQVDIESCADGGHNVGWTDAGEWLQYTVNVKEAGTYDLLFRVASTGNTGRVRLSVEGQDVTQGIDLPNTGGWQTWQTVSVENVSLKAGEQKLRLHVDNGGFNINWFEATAAVAAQPVAVSLTAPEPGASLESGMAATVAATVGESDSIVRIEFFAGETKIGERTVAPYSISWTPEAEGNVVLTARATGATGEQTTSAPVEITVVGNNNQTRPFLSSPASIPGPVYAVEFDNGGPGVAYHDTSSQNSGGALRPDEQVDIEASSGEAFSHNVGWIQAGEWLEYTVDVAHAGTYQVDFRVASAMSNGRLHLRAKDAALTESIAVPNTGGWQNWTTLSAKVQLEAGEQVLRLAMDSGEFNIGSMEFQSTAEQTLAAFNEWQESSFSPQERNDPAVSGPTADPDGDGLPNLMEYALGQDPLGSDRSALPEAGHVTLNGDSYLTLTYRRTAGATDLAYIPEASTDMTTWTSGNSATVPVSVTPEGAMEKVVVRDAQPLKNGKQRFLRLRIEQK